MITTKSSGSTRPSVLAKYHKYELYEASVQDPEGEIDFLLDTYREIYGKTARVFREDFCATFLNCIDWIKRSPRNKAIGVDLDKKTLDYGKKHHLSKLTPAQKQQIQLMRKNVLQIRDPKADIIGASNFSVFFMKKRADLVRYFDACYQGLKSKGIVSVDVLGGMEMGEPNKEKRKIKLPDGKKISYIWEQVSYNPVNSEALFYIHFKLPSGKMMKRQFTYDWRLWSIREIREAMEEVGFKKTFAYWEGDDDDGGGNGVFTPVEKEENCPVWLSYVVGAK